MRRAEAARTAIPVLDRVLNIVAETTRYPADVLAPDADLEDELGIDSVKRGEIAARLATAFRLTREDLGGLAQARTLADLAQRLASRGGQPPAPHPAPAKFSPPANGHPAEDLLGRVTAIAARATRYPAELLQPDADFEDELGIDSVKFGEILAAIRVEFPALPPGPAEGRPARTLRELTARLMTLLGKPSVAATPAAEAPAPARERPQPAGPLAGKVAFVSGSGRGLGRATALELARRGAVVAVNSFHSRDDGEETVHAIRAAGGRAEHFWGSLARPDHIDRVFDELAARCPPLDFFIHNASDGAFTTLAEATEDQWLRSFRVNVIGLQHAALRAARLMGERGGRILTLSSVFRDEVVDYFGVQGTVKAAVEALTRFLARELLPQGITVNCVSFASLDGAVMRAYPEAGRINGAVARGSLHGRRSDDAEAARVLAMLLGDDAAPMTGAVLRVDRGFTVTRPLRT